MISLYAVPLAAVHHCMLLLQAEAVSTPIASGFSSGGSASGVSTSMHSHSQSVSTTAAVESSSPQNPFTARELELIEELDIPMCLTRQVPGKSLHDFWEWYQAGLAAIATSSKMKKKPTEKSITDIFIGKLQWFNWSKVFIKVKPYDDMVKWLNEADNSLNDKEVWKCELDDHSLENLKLWVNNGGKLVDKGKGKAKAGGEEDKKQKKKKEAEV